MDETICAGIVTYNPEIRKLENTIRSIITQVSKVVICDNGSSNIKDIIEFVKIRFTQHEIEIIELDENRGIATALNFLVKKADEMGYRWIITLDQDSESPKTLVEELKKYTNEMTAIVAPHIMYRGNDKYIKVSDVAVEEVEWVITSASLTNVNAWKAIHGYDEVLFIDKVDYDFCIRAHRAGYKIKKVNSVSLTHELGDLKCRKLLGKTIYVTNHNAFRRYYMVRNSLYLQRKLGIGSANTYIVKNILKILLFENDKLKKLEAINRGIKDAKMMG